MANATIERLTEKHTSPPAIGTLPIGAAKRVLKGVLVGIDANGFVGEAGSTGIVKILGMASATIDNRLGAAGDIMVDIQYGTFSWNNDTGSGAVKLGDIGKLCYAADNQTVSMVGTLVAGIVVDVNEKFVRVWSGPFVLNPPSS